LVIDDFFDPVPFYRSILFWSGLFILAFLLWAWLESHRSASSYTRYDPVRDRTISLSLHSSALGAMIHTNYPVPGHPDAVVVRISALGYRRILTHPDNRTPLLPAPFWENRYHDPQRPDPRLKYHQPEPGTKVTMILFCPTRTTTLRIPFWLILAAYLPLWTGLLYYRHRRIKKRRQQFLPPPAQPQTD
jgi:hypothetical protein